MTHEMQIAHSTYLSTHIKKRISVGGIDVDEDFVKELLIKHLRQGDANDRPTLSDAFDIYMAENTSAHRRKFKLNANQYFNRFSAMYGDLYLDELKHWHITQYRDAMLAQGLHPQCSACLIEHNISPKRVQSFYMVRLFSQRHKVRELSEDYDKII